MNKTYTFMLTVSMGKRLIARGLMTHPGVQRAMREHRLVIVAGTTNAYVAEEALRLIGCDTPFDRRTYRRGITVAPGAKVTPGQAEFDLIIERGKARFDCDIFAIAPELGEGDMILKGANALYLPAKEAGVLIGHPEGGTLMPITAAAIGRRVQLMVPIGVEKRVEKPISELSRIANAAPGEGPRLAPIPGTVYTELDALAALTGVSAHILASGGAMGAEGAVYFTACGTEGQIARLKALVGELRSEPPAAL